jgi:hypothetical protein
MNLRLRYCVPYDEYVRNRAVDMGLARDGHICIRIEIWCSSHMIYTWVSLV